MLLDTIWTDLDASSLVWLYRTSNKQHFQNLWNFWVPRSFILHGFYIIISFESIRTNLIWSDKTYLKDFWRASFRNKSFFGTLRCTKIIFLRKSFCIFLKSVEKFGGSKVKNKGSKGSLTFSIIRNIMNIWDFGDSNLWSRIMLYPFWKTLFQKIK